jgi:hypothetical protein
VDAQRIKVLHVAHSDAVVVRIAHNLDDTPTDSVSQAAVRDDTRVRIVRTYLILDLLPALEGLLDEDLLGLRKGHGGQLAQLVDVVGKARTEAAKREASPHHHRITC